MFSLGPLPRKNGTKAPLSPVWRSLPSCHFSIPYAYASHSVTLKCHSVQLQANTPSGRLSRSLRRRIHSPHRFPAKQNARPAPFCVLKTSRPCLPVRWREVLHGLRGEDAEREGPLCGTGMQSVGKVAPPAAPPHKTPHKAGNTSSTYFFPRINTNPGRCHWSADVEKSGE